MNASKLFILTARAQSQGIGSGTESLLPCSRMWPGPPALLLDASRWTSRAGVWKRGENWGWVQITGPSLCPS